jgi:hypothetical protein
VLVTLVDRRGMAVSEGATVSSAQVSRVVGRGVVLLAAANPSRQQVLIYNAGNEEICVKLGTGASETSFSFALASGALYESRGSPVYTGSITGFGRQVAAQVTEL